MYKIKCFENKFGNYYRRLKDFERIGLAILTSLLIQKPRNENQTNLLHSIDTASYYLRTAVNTGIIEIYFIGQFIENILEILLDRFY